MKTIKKEGIFAIAVFLLFIFGLNNHAFTQKNSKSLFQDRFFTGGGLGLQFGTVTFIDISPILGYMLTDNIAVGVGVTYNYYEDKRFDPVFSTNIFGASAFARYYFLDSFLEKIFLHAEYEILNFEAMLVNAYGFEYKDRIYVSGFLVGGGYREPIGARSFLSLTILWDVIEDINSPYINPVIRVGINIGI